MRTQAALLQRLARLYHIQTAYIDMEKRRIAASPDAILAALNSLGADLSGEAGLAAALQARERDLWHWHLEAAAVAWQGEPAALRLALPERGAPDALQLELKLESGETSRWSLAAQSLQPVARREIDGEGYVAIDLQLPAEVPSGYHRLSVEGGGHELESWIISAPKRAYRGPDKRRWGVFLPLYALHSERSCGTGDLTDLQGLLDWSSDKGASFTGTLPLLATFLDDPFDASPYSPVSRLFWNELYVDVVAAGGDAAPADEARQLVRDATVDYRQAMACKRRALSAAAASPEASRFVNSALAARPEIEDYARFRGAIEKLGTDWRTWPERARTGHLKPGDYHQGSAAYFALAQAALEVQMQGLSREARARGASLYLDMPVGVHALGYDAWRYQALFARIRQWGRRRTS
jgi:4-alpha-glucanotransferase